MVEEIQFVHCGDGAGAAASGIICILICLFSVARFEYAMFAWISGYIFIPYISTVQVSYTVAS